MSFEVVVERGLTASEGQRGVEMQRRAPVRLTAQGVAFFRGTVETFHDATNEGRLKNETASQGKVVLEFTLGLDKFDVSSKSGHFVDELGQNALGGEDGSVTC